MYQVSKSTDEKYGKVIVITSHQEKGEKTPFFAMQRALKSKRLWRKKRTFKVRFLVDGQIMTLIQLEKWAADEYKSLPKCANCAVILDGDVYTHQFCGSNLFCSQACADQSYDEEIEEMNEEEIEYL